LSIQLGGDVADQCGQVPAGGVSVGAAQKYGLELRSFIAAHDRYAIEVWAQLFPAGLPAHPPRNPLAKVWLERPESIPNDDHGRHGQA
jgi:hypothetical protein